MPKLFIWAKNYIYAVLASDVEEARQVLKATFEASDDILAEEPEIMESPAVMVIYNSGCWRVEQVRGGDGLRNREGD